MIFTSHCPATLFGARLGYGWGNPLLLSTLEYGVNRSLLPAAPVPCHPGLGTSVLFQPRPKPRALFLKHSKAIDRNNCLLDLLALTLCFPIKKATPACSECSGYANEVDL